MIDIIEKRKMLLEILEEKIESGELDLKVIETYNRILSELRQDLKNNEDGDGVPNVFEEVFE